MGWIIGICVVVLALIFWRVSVPVLLVGGILVWLYFASLQEERNERVQQTFVEVRAAKQRIEKAQVDPSAKAWSVSNEPDPASGNLIPRRASVVSDDGLCLLQVEERLDGTRLTSISCADLAIKVHYATGVDVKFDTTDTSDTMRLSSFSGGDGAYLSSEQDYGYGHLDYDDFLRRIATSSKLAIHVDFRHAGDHWIRFSLDGSAAALGDIGALPNTQALMPSARNALAYPFRD